MANKKWLSMLVVSGAISLSTLPAHADSLYLSAGNLVVTRSVYSGDGSSVTIGQTLPGGGLAVADGTYPGVFANETPDPSFGITSPIMLDLVTSSGLLVGSFDLSNAMSTSGINLSTSFPSKSEIAINQSPDGTLTLMGYVSPINTLDVSNSNTPNHVDPTNPVKSSYQRAVAQLNNSSGIQITPVNAYSGNNGRAAILHNGNYYMVGNAGNGSGTEPTNIVNNTGVQMTTPGGSAETTVIGTPQGTPGASNGFQYGYSVVLNGQSADKSGKDDNFRGIAAFNNTLYVTKGSGSNGINTVYQVGTAGTLPTASTAATTNISILPGFSTTLARSTTGVVYHPFGIWFANDSTLYVADEGDGLKTTDSKKTNYGGLQKWIKTNGTWTLAYTLQNGLNLGTQYSLPNYPASLNPATDGLRNISGKDNGDGTVTIYGVTSTVSSNVDQGADPNSVVGVTDSIAYTTAAQAANEAFTTLELPTYGVVYRGVAVTSSDIQIAGEVSTQVSVTTGGFVYSRATRLYTGNLTVTDNSLNQINGRIFVCLNKLASGVTLVNTDGTYNMAQYKTVTNSGLAAGASITIPLQFSNPTNARINFIPVTYQE